MKKTTSQKKKSSNNTLRYSLLSLAILTVTAFVLLGGIGMIAKSNARKEVQEVISNFNLPGEVAYENIDQTPKCVSRDPNAFIRLNIFEDPNRCSVVGYKIFRNKGEVFNGALSADKVLKSLGFQPSLPLDPKDNTTVYYRSGKQYFYATLYYVAKQDDDTTSVFENKPIKFQDGYLYGVIVYAAYN